MATKNVWTADIGEWESGKNIDLPGVATLSEAVSAATQRLGEITVPQPFVVQVYYDGKIVWDYFNGKIGDCP